MTVNPAHQIFVSIDRICDYIPIVSSITNIFDLFFKHVILPFLSRETIDNNYFYLYLEYKPNFRCIILVGLPFIGNLVAGIADLIAYLKFSGQNPNSDEEQGNFISSLNHLKKLKLSTPDLFEGSSPLIKLANDVLSGNCSPEAVIGIGVYRNLALISHPDKNPSNQILACSVFQCIVNAKIAIESQATMT